MVTMTSACLPSLLLSTASNFLSQSSSTKLSCIGNPRAAPLPFSRALFGLSNYQLMGRDGRRRVLRRTSRVWRVSSVSEEALPADVVVVKAEKIVPAAAEVGIGSTIVSALLFIAFISLSLLSIGVIYLAVQDFLQKREREKFEKEDAEKKKKSGKKAKVRAKTGPRGFGQKIEQDDD